MALDSTADALSIKTFMDNFIIGGGVVLTPPVPDPDYSLRAAEAKLIKLDLDNLIASGASYDTIEAKRSELIAAAGSTSGSDPNLLARAIDAGFQNAVPSETNVDITGVAGTLVFTPGPPMHLMIAKACKDYWVAAIDPGTPVAFPITGVSNDAAKIETPIADAILALATATAYSNPPYKDLVDAIHTEVKKIIWTVDEAAPPATASYSVTVS